MTPGAVVIITAVFTIAGLVTGLVVGCWLARRPSVDEMADSGFSPALDRSEAWEWQVDFHPTRDDASILSWGEERRNRP